MAKLRPYLKYFIAGGNVCGMGGFLLLLGVLLSLIMRFVGSNVTITMAVVFIIISIIALIIGITLLFKGVNERNIWLQVHRYNQTESESDMPRDQPVRRVESPVNTGRYCPVCGQPLPDLPHISFCPKCGEPLE